MRQVTIWLMGTFVTSVAGVAFYQAIAPSYPNMSVAPDWLLGVLFGAGGMAGMYLGARCQKFVPESAINMDAGRRNCFHRVEIRSRLFRVVVLAVTDLYYSLDHWHALTIIL